MANFVFNVAKGKIAYYAGLTGGANDALILVLVKSSGVESDATLKDKDDLAAVFSGATDEAGFTGYARRTLASVTVNVDDSADEVWIDAADPTGWTNSGSSEAISDAIIAYDPDTTGGTDSDLIPLCMLDYSVTFDTGVPVTLTFGATGFMAAT